jgi:hypothetical protein
MAKGKKVRLRLAKDHVWKSSPGYQIVVIDRGAARVDIPVGWHLDFVETGLEVRNFPKPDDTCLIQITVLPMPNEVDWRSLPLVPLFKNAMEHGGSEVLRRGPIVEVKREGLHGVWQETRYIDPEEHKEAASFCILARDRGIHVFITLSCWPEGVPEFLPVWDEILRSLRIGEYVDATTGRRIRPREN